VDKEREVSCKCLIGEITTLVLPTFNDSYAAILCDDHIALTDDFDTDMGKITVPSRVS
jgi:hypothetical protein